MSMYRRDPEWNAKKLAELEGRHHSTSPRIVASKGESSTKTLDLLVGELSSFSQILWMIQLMNRYE